MTTKTITRKSRKFGWGWSNVPTGEDAYSIETPTKPDYEGTVKTVLKNKSKDRTWKSMKSGGTFTNQAYFIDGQRIKTDQVFHYELDDLLSGDIDEMSVEVE